MTLAHKDVLSQFDLPEGISLDQSDKALGLLSCAPDDDYRGLLQALNGSLPTPVIGGTSLANPFETGDDPATTNLSFLDKKDVRYAISLSPPLANGSTAQQMACMYNGCLQKLGEAPKLFFLFSPILPALHISSFATELFRLAGDVPIFGGMVSDGPDGDAQAVFADGYYHRDRMLLVGFAGDIKPVFGIGCQTTAMTDYSPIITAAKGNVIERVDNMTLLSYLEKLGMNADSAKEFPLSIRRCRPDGHADPVQHVDALVAIDKQTGSGTLSNDVAVGDTVKLVVLTRENIVQSTTSACEMLAAEMATVEKTGYQFEMVFAVSCISRYYMMSGGERMEANILAKMLPGEQSRFGFFGFMEICPEVGGATFANRVFGQSLALCAL